MKLNEIKLNEIIIERKVNQMTLNQVENTKEYKERRVNIMIRKSFSFLPILRRRSNAREFSVGMSFFLFFAELKK